MKKAVVTGASGFIGRYLIDELISNNVFVYAITRQLNNFSDKYKNNKFIKVIYCDLNDIDKLLSLIDDDIETFYHLAWCGVSDSGRYNYIEQFKNINNSIKLINALKKWNVKKFVGAGSIHEYECISALKSNSLSDIKCDAYKISKLYAHLAMKDILEVNKIKFFWPIIINTFGAGEISNRLIYTTINKMINNVSPVFLSDGNQIYDFVYVSDVARALFLISEYGINNKNYIINSGNSHSLKYYLYAMRDIINPTLDIFFSKDSGQSISDYNFDLSSLKNDTGFEPIVSFEDGIKQTTNWIKHEMRIK